MKAQTQKYVQQFQARRRQNELYAQKVNRFLENASLVIQRRDVEGVVHPFSLKWITVNSYTADMGVEVRVLSEDGKRTISTEASLLTQDDVREIASQMGGK